jgi:hypothetical protein
VLLSTPASEEIGAMGREIESRQGIRWKLLIICKSEEKSKPLSLMRAYFFPNKNIIFRRCAQRMSFLARLPCCLVELNDFHVFVEANEGLD